VDIAKPPPPAKNIYDCNVFEPVNLRLISSLLALSRKMVLVAVDTASRLIHAESVIGTLVTREFEIIILEPLACTKL